MCLLLGDPLRCLLVPSSPDRVLGVVTLLLGIGIGALVVSAIVATVVGVCIVLAADRWEHPPRD